MSRFSDVLNYIQILAPAIIAATVPRGELLAPIVAKGIADAHKLGDQVSGEEKKKLVLDLATDAIEGYNTVASPDDQIDKATTVSAVDHAIETTLDVVKIVAGLKVAVPAPAATVNPAEA